MPEQDGLQVSMRCGPAFFSCFLSKALTAICLLPGHFPRPDLLQLTYIETYHYKAYFSASYRDISNKRLIHRKISRKAFRPENDSLYSMRGSAEVSPESTYIATVDFSPSRFYNQYSILIVLVFPFSHSKKHKLSF